MNIPPAPPHHDDLDGSLKEALGLLSRAVRDRRSPWRTPTLCTVGLDGWPQGRTVVLRAFDVERRCLRFHTDRRSGKVAQLGAEPRAQLHFYDSKRRVQLRLWVNIEVLTQGPEVERSWAAMGPMARRCYMAVAPPGTRSQTPTDGRPEDWMAAAQASLEDESAPLPPGSGQESLTVLLATFERAEWLSLAFAGHRRACFDWTSGQMRSWWLVP